jgi:peptidoglycan/LPS O-acetylase OafA/YrhL
LIGSDWRLSFADYPAAHWGAMLDGLHPAWTLGAELTFYLVAPLLMRSWKLGVALLALTFGTRACFVWHVGPGLHEPWTYYFAPSTFCFFLFGHFICRAGLRWDAFTANRKLAFMLLAASITTMALGNYDNFDSLRFWISILCFSAALPSIFAATKDLRLLNLMGNVSFSVYLIHILVFVWFGGLISKLAVSPLPRLSAYVSVLVALAFVLLAAVVAHSAETIVAYALRVALGIRSRLLRAPAE